MRVSVLIACGALLLGCSEDPEVYMTPADRGQLLAGTLADYAECSRDVDLPIQVWYPVSEGVEAPHNYDIFEATLGSVVLEGPGDCSEPRPVVMFSHGNGGINYQTYGLGEHLARHGYVVAAPDHVDNTAFDLDDELRLAMCLRRPLDISESFDWLVAQAEDAESPLFGCVDEAAGYAVMGHSFGGWTTLAVAGAPLDMTVLADQCVGSDSESCQIIGAWIADHPGEDTLDLSDSRVWAAAPLAPAWQEVFGDGLPGISVPIMVVGGELDDSTTWDDSVLPTYQGLTATPRFLVGLEGAGHYSFTNFCDIILLMGWEGDGCGEGYRAVEDVLVTLQTLTLAFLEVQRGDERARDWLPPEPGISHFESVE